MPNKYYAYDARLESRPPGQAAITATTNLATISQRAAMRTEYLTKVTLEVIKVSALNEGYTMAVQVTNDSFATFECAALLSLGHSSVRLASSASNLAPATFEFDWSTEVGGVVYKDWRVRLILAGTAPSIQCAINSTIRGA